MSTCLICCLQLNVEAGLSPGPPMTTSTPARRGELGKATAGLGVAAAGDNLDTSAAFSHEESVE